jgi:hypothetical protein
MVLANSITGGGSLAGVQMVNFWLCSHMAFLIARMGRKKGESFVHTFSSYKDTKLV